MLKTLFDGVVFIHVLAGIIAIATFWLPTLARKGGPLHKRVGRYYSYAMYSVALSALLLCSVRLFSPLPLLPADLTAAAPERIARFVARSQMIGGFLGVLAILVIANVRHGLLVLAAKAERVQLRAPAHLLLLVVLLLAGSIGTYAGFSRGFVLLQIFGPLAALNAVGMARYSFKTSLTPRQWIIEHLGNLLGAGIATHTAVLVFGAGRIVNQWLPAGYELLPWVAPGVIGIIASQLYSRHYRKRFAKPAAVTVEVEAPAGVLQSAN